VHKPRPQKSHVPPLHQISFRRNKPQICVRCHTHHLL